MVAVFLLQQALEIILLVTASLILRFNSKNIFQRVKPFARQLRVID